MSIVEGNAAAAALAIPPVGIQELPTARLRLLNPGSRFHGRELDNMNVSRLMESMREHGFWKSSPLRVRPIKIQEGATKDVDGWEIISRQHRFEAAWRLNFETAPVRHRG